MEKLAEAWAKKLGTEVEFWLGDGEFGEAYDTVDGRVIKITSDPREFLVALRLQDSGRQFDRVADIYATHRFPDGSMGIYLEKLDIEGDHEHLMAELQEEAELQGVDWLDVDPDDIQGWLSDEAIAFLDDIGTAVFEYNRCGCIVNDLHSGNMGRNAEGRYALFDQIDKGMDMSWAAQEVEQLWRDRQTRPAPQETLTL